MAEHHLYLIPYSHRMEKRSWEGHEGWADKPTDEVFRCVAPSKEIALSHFKSTMLGFKDLKVKHNEVESLELDAMILVSQ